MDIISTSENPVSRSLSNFTEHSFILDGVKIRSMENFLQSLKLKVKSDEDTICLLPIFEARKICKNAEWWINGILYWREKSYNRFRKEYQELLDLAFEALYKNPEFKKSLESTKDEKLTHKIGNSNTRNTVLTESEFISRLIKLRKFGYIRTKRAKELF